MVGEWRPMLPSIGAPRVYHHIVAHIERAIYDGTLSCGDKLPSERELGRRFGSSRVAVRCVSIPAGSRFVKFVAVARKCGPSPAATVPD